MKENITFALMNGGKTNSAAEANDIAMEYIQKVKLDRFENTYPHMLSGGMKQRVAIARGMAMEPDILLMDEPFAALDALTRRQMQEELLELWDETRFTVLFVTHSIEEAVIVGSRILIMSPHPGQVKAELNAHDQSHATIGQDDFAELQNKIHNMIFADRVLEDEGNSACPSDGTNAVSLHVRDEFENTGIEEAVVGDIERRLTLWERVSNMDPVRKLSVLVLLVVAWEIYTRSGEING